MGRLTGVMGEERSQGPVVGERGKTRGTREQCSHRGGEGTGLEARGIGLCPLPALVERTRNSHGCRWAQCVQRAPQGVHSDGDGRQTKGQTWGYTEARRGPGCLNQAGEEERERGGHSLQGLGRDSARNG